MAKRPDSNESVLLALELLRRIPRHGKVTADQLHKQLKNAGIERDLRSIQRQLKALSERFEIERDERSKPHGYRWLPSAQALAMPQLSAQESLLLRLAEEHLRNLLPSKLMKSMDGFFKQARRNLAENDNAKLERDWTKKVRVVASTSLLEPKVRTGILEAASEALYGNRWLKIAYTRADGKATKSNVMPLALVQQENRLYLVCRFENFEDTRNLALHRFKSAEASTLTFERPKDFDLERYEEDGRFRFGDGTKVRLSFNISEDFGRHLLETPLSTDQKTKEQPDGSLRITATVVDTLMLTQWLRGFGDEVWNISKRRLVQRVKESA